MLKNTTLSAVFRKWLQSFARQDQAARGYRELMSALAYASPGRRFTREDMNAR